MPGTEGSGGIGLAWVWAFGQISWGSGAEASGEDVVMVMFPYSDSEVGGLKDKALAVEREYLEMRKFAEWVLRMPKSFPSERSRNSKTFPEVFFLRGFLPPVLFVPEEAHVSDWWGGYIRTYLERDLRDLTQITNLPDFRKMMGFLAMRSGQILKQSEIARDAGLSQATAGRYINLLEVSGLLTKLAPYSRNISKRLVKSPKVFLVDPGLMCALGGFKNTADIPSLLKGALFETFVFLNLLALARAIDGQIYYFRTQGGKEREIDFLFEVKGKVFAIEAKYSSTVSLRDAENLLFLKDILPNWTAGIVVYNGSEVVRLGKEIYAIPWSLI
jgi:hypothetical protein